MAGLSIPLPENFSFSECRWFLDRNYDDCVHQVTDHSVIKPTAISSKQVIFELSERPVGLNVEILFAEPGFNDFDGLSAYVHEWLDMERDLTDFYKVLNGKDELAYMPQAFSGLRLIGIPELFEAICWCIIGQQINLTFAYKLKRRMVEQYGQSMELNGQVHHFFPKPEVLAELEIDDLKALQFSRQKADYVIHVSKLISSGELSKEKLLMLPDRNTQLSALTDVRGIGEWTANYVLMKTLKDMDCITIGDTGLNSALDQHGLVEDKKDKNEVRAFFDPFQGWKSYLVIYLWRSLSKYDFQAK